MEKIIDFYEKRIKIILGIILGVCILNCIIRICKDIKISEIVLGFGISIGFFFIAWAMVFIVLGFQKINPFCPKSIFKFFCYFVIINGDSFMRIIDFMPYIVKMEFDGNVFLSKEELFHIKKNIRDKYYFSNKLNLLKKWNRILRFGEYVVF